MSDLPGILAERFAHVAPIHSGGAFSLHACREVSSGRRLVLVVGAAGHSRRWLADQLDHVAAVHRVLSNPFIPAVHCRGSVGDTEFLTYDCAAGVALDRVMVWAGASQVPRTPYEDAIGIIEVAASALVAGHQAQDPLTSRPVCLPTFGPRNVLVEDNGRPWVVGFGHDVTNSAGPGGAVLGGTSQAPEISVGRPASPAADVYALFFFVRSQLPHVKLPRKLIEAYNSSPKWQQEFAQLQFRAGAFNAEDRFQTIDAMMSVYRRWWEHLGFDASTERFIKLLRERQLERLQGHTAQVARDGSWFERPPAARVSLARRRSLARILRVLAEMRAEHPGREVPTSEIIEAGWPGEKLLPESGLSRVYVAISTLRKLGLGEILKTVGRGYVLDAEIPMTIVAEDGAEARAN